MLENREKKELKQDRNLFKLIFKSLFALQNSFQKQSPTAVLKYVRYSEKGAHVSHDTVASFTQKDLNLVCFPVNVLKIFRISNFRGGFSPSPQSLCFAITCFFCNHFEELQTVLHALFYKQLFFRLNLSVAKRFPELSFKCCLDIA